MNFRPKARSLELEKLKTIDNTSAADNIGITVVITASGPVVNPSIYHVEEGESITVGTSGKKMEMTAGDKLVITTETNNKHAYLIRGGVQKEVNEYLSEDSEFIQLQHGSNTLGYLAESGDDYMTVEVSYRYRYLGV